MSSLRRLLDHSASDRSSITINPYSALTDWLTSNTGTNPASGNPDSWSFTLNSPTRICAWSAGQPRAFFKRFSGLNRGIGQLKHVRGSNRERVIGELISWPRSLLDFLVMATLSFQPRLSVLYINYLISVLIALPAPLLRHSILHRWQMGRDVGLVGRWMPSVRSFAQWGFLQFWL